MFNLYLRFRVEHQAHEMKTAHLESWQDLMLANAFPLPDPSALWFGIALIHLILRRFGYLTSWNQFDLTNLSNFTSFYFRDPPCLIGSDYIIFHNRCHTLISTHVSVKGMSDSKSVRQITLESITYN